MSPECAFVAVNFLTDMAGNGWWAVRLLTKARQRHGRSIAALITVLQREPFLTAHVWVPGLDASSGAQVQHHLTLHSALYWLRCSLLRLTHGEDEARTVTLFEDDRHLAEGLFVREIWMLSAERICSWMIFGQQPVVQIQVCTVSRELKAKCLKTNPTCFVSIFFCINTNNSQTRSPNTATQKLSCVLKKTFKTNSFPSSIPILPVSATTGWKSSVTAIHSAHVHLL